MYNTQHNFTYSAALAIAYDVEADDYVGLFVNCNKATVRYALTNTQEDAQHMFEVLLANTYTHENDEAYPVIVYMQANMFVAWYDWENMCGYIATTSTQQQAVAA
jgi:hypothetical protein